MGEKHTPAPWHYGHVGTDALWIGPGYNQTPVAHVDHDMEYARDNSRANAAFIVRAVNAHDDLVEALRAARQYLEGGNPLHASGGHRNTDLRDLIDAALSRHGEGK